MPLYASNFTANSLSGAVRVSGGTANIRLIVEPFAFEGNKQFTLKLRKDSITGTVIYTTTNIAIFDTSVISNVTANLASVNEGNLISFTINTSNVPNNSNVYFSLLNVAGNVDSADFLYNGFRANTGRVTIINNVGTFVLQANADLSVKDEENETFKLQVRTNSPFGNIVYTTANVVITDISSNLPPANGQAEYTVAGTYSWIAPLRVSTVSVVAIGGGGGGYSGPPGTPTTLGGGGGGLGWKNNIPVITGNPYTVVVGNGGRAGDYVNPAVGRIGGTGNASYFIDITTVAGYGGSGGGSGVSPFVTGGYGGGYVGDGGGNGGSGVQDTFMSGGGGGAGGYSGNGGDGGGSVNYSGRNGGLGSGGGGAGGNGGAPVYEGGGGGGVGIYGQGNSGVRLETITSPQPGWPNNYGTGGGGGSGGNNGTSASPVDKGNGGTFGGGGGGGYDNPVGAGAGGAVRIIWGGGRYFPNVMTGNVF